MILHVCMDTVLFYESLKAQGFILRRGGKGKVIDVPLGTSTLQQQCPLKPHFPPSPLPLPCCLLLSPRLSGHTSIASISYRIPLPPPPPPSLTALPAADSYQTRSEYLAARLDSSLRTHLTSQVGASGFTSWN
jgi:hypothetical protein